MEFSMVTLKTILCLCAVFAVESLGAAANGNESASNSTLNLVRIDFKQFPDGRDVPERTILRKQYASLGISFAPLYPGGPYVGTAHDGRILWPGNPPGFYGSIKMNFAEWCAPTHVVIDVIGSGTPIGARIRGFTPSAVGTVVYRYKWSTGVDAPMAFIAPEGHTLTSVVHYGWLNETAGAMISAVSFNCTGTAKK